MHHQVCNHAVKNYGKALYKTKSDTSVSVSGRKFLTVKNIKALQDIAMKVWYINAHGLVGDLKADLLNGPNHKQLYQGCDTTTELAGGQEPGGKSLAANNKKQKLQDSPLAFTERCVDQPSQSLEPDYDPKSVKPLMSEAQYNLEKQKILQNVQVTRGEVAEIELHTRVRWDNPKYLMEGRGRLKYAKEELNENRVLW
ncbi:hypothetical protein ILUMI_13608 [Ignelater luminosus]|uniref:Uncharacterized protein n=1 Tax=Ignelater luminosus TaxID=2038154 RepID=A0A8K0CY77_IGNLU|nr:hypothetical protein ILUMI_13608 [Ignelater luminosus]